MAETAESFDDGAHLDAAVQAALDVYETEEAEELAAEDDEPKPAAKPKAKAKPAAKGEPKKPEPANTQGLDEDDKKFAEEFDERRNAEAKREADAERKRVARAKAAKQPKPEAAPEPEGDEGSDEPDEDLSPIDRKAARARFKQSPHEAVQELFGKEALAALKIDPKAFHALREGRRKLDAQAQAQRAELDQVVGKLRERSEQVKNLAEARKAYEAGDYQTAFEKAFGEDVNSFQKRALRQRAGEDPRVSKLERELRERQQREEQMVQRQRAEQAQQRKVQAQRQLHADITAELESIADDGRIPAAAKHPEFVRAVIEELRSSYDRRTNTTIPTDEAAAIVLNRFADVNARWNKILRAQELEQATDRAAPVQRRRRVALSQAGASEAATPTDSRLSDDELLAKHARLMRQAQLSERLA